MKTMDFGSNDEPMVKKKSNTRNLKIALGLAAIILIPAVGSTLAGSISINSGSALNFGQGVVQATACGNVTLTPSTSFSNSSGAGTFNLGTVTLSSVPSACSGRTFTIKAYGDSATVITTLSTRTGSGIIVTPTLSANTCTVAVPVSPATANETATCTADSSSIGNIVITVATGTSASSIYKFTVEES